MELVQLLPAHYSSISTTIKKQSRGLLRWLTTVVGMMGVVLACSRKIGWATLGGQQKQMQTAGGIWVADWDGCLSGCLSALLAELKGGKPVTL